MYLQQIKILILSNKMHDNLQRIKENLHSTSFFVSKIKGL